MSASIQLLRSPRALQCRIAMVRSRQACRRYHAASDRSGCRPLPCPARPAAPQLGGCRNSVARRSRRTRQAADLGRGLLFLRRPLGRIAPGAPLGSRHRRRAPDHEQHGAEIADLQENRTDHSVDESRPCRSGDQIRANCKSNKHNDKATKKKRERHCCSLPCYATCAQSRVDCHLRCLPPKHASIFQPVVRSLFTAKSQPGSNGRAHTACIYWTSPWRTTRTLLPKQFPGKRCPCATSYVAAQHGGARHVSFVETPVL